MNNRPPIEMACSDPHDWQDEPEGFWRSLRAGLLAFGLNRLRRFRASTASLSQGVRK